MPIVSPPPPAGCLETPYPSSQKGGTLIAEDVTDVETHRRRLADPDGYRPDRCHNCLFGTLHAHDFRERKPKQDPEHQVMWVRRYRCAYCGAVWQVLPGFLARWLHRSWEVVEGAVAGSRSPSQPQVPHRTLQRWRERLRCSARRLVSVLASSGEPRWEALAGRVGPDATRAALLAAWQRGMASLAALVHRLVPGVRLM